MTMPSDTAPDAAFEPRVATPLSATRPFYWSVRREIWENRSLYIAPLAVAALALVGFLISAIGMPERRLTTLMLSPEKQAAVISQPYDFAAMALIVTMAIVAAAYCLSALHSERRDRSILFWKSLPVSDLTTVLSKMAVPMAVLPVVTAAVVLATQLATLLLSTVILAVNGVSPAVPLELFSTPVVLIYGLVTMTLWYAPIYAWFLLVSGWARRVTFLWAVLPPLGLCAFERLAFGTTHLARLLAYRMSGGVSEAFISKAETATKAHGHIPVVGLSQLDPGKFLASPGLWLGLIFVAACLAGAVWLRRRREPI
jgi:ABC-2 type transport system permease protein